MNIAERARVAEMISFSRQGSSINQINYDNIVTYANMREYLGNWIPEGKVWLDKRGKSKKSRKGEPKADAPGGPTEKAPKKKKAPQPPVAAFKPRHPTPWKVKKQTTVASREVVPEVRTAATPKAAEASIPATTINREPFGTEREVTPGFRFALVDEDSEGGESLNPP